jgi:hypothetical protein
MRDRARWLPWWRRVPIWVLLVTLVVPVIVVVRSPGRAGGMSFGRGVLVSVFVVLIALSFARLVAMLAGVDPGAIAIAHELASAPDQRRLLARWLRRTRWARNVGGVAGFTAWTFTLLAGDVLLYGVGGIAIGSMVAQLHHARRPRGRRTASLDRRMVGAYISIGSRRRMIAVAILSVGLIIAGVALNDTGTAASWGLVAFVELAAAHLVQRRVAARPRPALTTGLRQADDLLRGLAIDRGLAQPATYFALFLFAHGSRQLEPILGGAATMISVGTWLYGLYAWWQNRRLGLDFLIEQPPAVAAEA